MFQSWMRSLLNALFPSRPVLRPVVARARLPRLPARAALRRRTFDA